MKQVLILLLIALLSCTSQISQTSIENAVQSNYQIVSEKPYNAELCQSISYSQKGHVNIGVRVIPIDAESGIEIQQQIRLSRALPGNGVGGESSSMGTHWDCVEGVEDTRIILTIYTKEYAPQVVTLTLPPNKLIDINIPLKKTCKGPTHAENEIAIANFLGTPYIKTRPTLSEFGLKEPETIICHEEHTGRGRTIKISGTYNKAAFEAYHAYGPCSSGGAGCIDTTCFTTADEQLFQQVKQHTCTQLLRFGEDKSKACFNGAYDHQTAKGKMFLVFYGSERSGFVVETGTNIDCMSYYR
ncbi:hypothetical protein COV18_04425 [Candidatus Woesearchaeota archaeon CG10_big_fil_rev_8_21_14_0_10_37_12]|nr:MAG: hypothetical protein COV18_04425 [Candidatus Woesearchaeota archaeon CG10_big_fil_rev_8_21_14_0_10_37_12]